MFTLSMILSDSMARAPYAAEQQKRGKQKSPDNKDQNVRESILMDFTKAQAFCLDHWEETLDLLKQLASIPAPSGQEGKRAAFILDWLKQQGKNDAYIDQMQNVVIPFDRPGEKDTVVIMAHTDIVFPDEGPIPVREEAGRLMAPGIGDDTANLVLMLMSVKYLLTYPHQARVKVLFVANSCEEGLGNLKGCREIMRVHGENVREFISYDGTLNKCTTAAVGSHRYRIRIRAEGGHSYGAFGNANAIHQMAQLVVALYQQKVPEGAKTTYNVGEIRGGTTVNTIAEEAHILYEYRSEDRDNLQAMEDSLQSILDQYGQKGWQIETEILGKRPCNGDLDPEKHQALIQRTLEDVSAHYHGNTQQQASSTDANIPLSLGIPAVTFGLILGGRAHTYEEWIEIDSLRIGCPLAIRTALHYFDEI